MTKREKMIEERKNVLHFLGTLLHMVDKRNVSDKSTRAAAKVLRVFRATGDGTRFSDAALREQVEVGRYACHALIRFCRANPSLFSFNDFRDIAAAAERTSTCTTGRW